MPTKEKTLLQETLTVSFNELTLDQEQGIRNFEELPKAYKNKAGNAVNWPKVLRRIGEIGKKKVPTEKESDFVNLAVQLSSNWVSCACGNQCAIIPRYGDGCPIDGPLEKLGMDFYDRVESAECAIHDKKSPYRALRSATATLNKIEACSAKLVKEIISQKK